MVTKNSGVIDDILAIRERWHTKNHPFFHAFGEGKLPLRVMGVYMALHWQFVRRALASLGLLYARTFACEDVRKALVENMAEEEGLKAIPREGHVPHDHAELIFRFCKAAGLSEAEVRGIKLTPAWWGRSLHYYQTALQEPIGVVLAMQTTQEGQQPALNKEVVLPAFARHYGYPAGAPRSSSSPSTRRRTSSTAAARRSCARSISTTTWPRRARSRSPNRPACCAGPRSPTSTAATIAARRTSCRPA